MKYRIKKVKRQKSIFSSLFLLMPAFCGLLSVGGCTSYSENFDCPIGEGLKCASLSEVNNRLDRGTMPLSSAPSQEACPSCAKVHWREDALTPSLQKAR